jgi:hypothetical protein
MSKQQLLIDETFEQKMLTLRDKVTHVLEDYPSARNCDKVFAQKFARIYDGCTVPVTAMKYSLASLLRERRKVQNLRPDLQAKGRVRHQREAHSRRYKGFYGGGAHGTR